MRVARSPLLCMLRALRDAQPLPPSFLDHPPHRFTPLTAWRDVATGEWIQRSST
jgi:hypothetical protein